MISEGSCDTEDWSNDAENSALLHMNKLCFKVYLIAKSMYFKVYLIAKIFHKFCSFVLYFWSNRYSINEHKKLL